MVKGKRTGASRTRCLFSLSLIVLCGLAGAWAQEVIKIETNKDPGRLRIAVLDFKVLNADPKAAPLNTVFNQTLWSDLDRPGIFDLVEKKLYPLRQPAQPEEINAKAWSEPPRSAGLLLFGNVSVKSGKVEIQGWLYDVRNAGASPILSKQYKEDATPENARMIAHHFADEIITRQSNSRYGWYMDLVRRRVWESWFTVGIAGIDPTVKARDRALIEFDIMIDGSPANVHLGQTSGVPSIDQSVMRAIQHIDSFGKPPTGSKITVEFWFDYPPK